MIPNYTLAAKATAALHESCGVNAVLDTRIINELLMMGANINAFDANGNTPLMIAAMNGAADKVDYLITCGACAGVRRNHDGANAQGLAVDSGHAHIARLLMRAPVYYAPRFNAVAGTDHAPAPVVTDNSMAPARTTLRLVP